MSTQSINPNSSGQPNKNRPKNFIDLTGNAFGSLTVLSRAENDNQGNVRWLCLCECGKLIRVRRASLMDGSQVSCGCYRKKMRSCPIVRSEKECSRCDIIKPITDFYKAKWSRDGTNSHCKECNCKTGKSNREKRPERDRERQRQYRDNNREKVREAAKRCYKKNAKRLGEAKKIYRETHRKEIRARWAVRDAIISGRLKRPDRCSKCGEIKKPTAHHHDYDKPLEVDWMCYQCHAKIHLWKK